MGHLLISAAVCVFLLVLFHCSPEANLLGEALDKHKKAMLWKAL